MTYCCGVLVRNGLVMVAGHAHQCGPRQHSTFRKLHIFEEPGQYVMALATAGNLSVSQSVISLLHEGVEDHEAGERQQLRDSRTCSRRPSLSAGPSRRIIAVDGPALEQSNVNFDVSFLLGGQIAGGPLRLFMVYSAGNFIECTTDTPFLQIGEHKYGKPVLDRAVNYDMDISRR